MDTATQLCVLLFVLAFGAVSKRLERTVVTPPMCFVAFGMWVAWSGAGDLGTGSARSLAHGLAELTLVLVLFTDAARIDLRTLRRELGLPVRLLGVGMPLTIVCGTVAAALLFPDWSFWEAAVLGVILAPTDAALGQAVVSSEAVPLRIRQTLNVESGLNDGISLPVLLVCVALAGAGAAEHDAAGWFAYAAKQVALGPLAGVGVGGAGAVLFRVTSARGWMSESFAKLTGLALALLTYVCAEAVGGNGFIAAFVGGMTLGNAERGGCKALYGFLEAEGQLLMLLVFLLVGATLAWPSAGRPRPPPPPRTRCSASRSCACYRLRPRSARWARA